MSTKQQVTTVTLDIKQTLDINQVISLLQSKIPHAMYESILRSLLATGYDINSDNGILLLSAMNANMTERVSLLLSLGAQTANAQGLLTSGHYYHAYHCSRALSKELVKLILNHTLASVYLDVIAKEIAGMNSRLDIFRCLESECPDDLARLYIKCGVLPMANRANDYIQKVCGAAGLWYPEIKAAHEAEKKRALELETFTAKFAEESAKLTSELAVSQERLAKANAIIAKLTTV